MPAILEGLTLGSLESLDPRIEVLFQKHVQQITQDCMNRPREKTKRRLVFEILFEPSVDPDTGECDEVKVTLEGKSKLPVFRTRSFPMQATKAGLRFNAESPDDINGHNGEE